MFFKLGNLERPNLRIAAGSTAEIHLLRGLINRPLEVVAIRPVHPDAPPVKSAFTFIGPRARIRTIANEFESLAHQLQGLPDS